MLRRRLPGRSLRFVGSVLAPALTLLTSGLCISAARGQESRADALAAATAAQVNPQRTITLDGKFEDWDGLEPVAWGADGHGGFASLGNVWAAYDGQWVYLRIQTGSVFNLQSVEGSIALHLNVDADVLTGVSEPAGENSLGTVSGKDAVITFSAPRDGGNEEGVTGLLCETSASAAFNVYDVGVESAPTHASGDFEIRMRRGSKIPGSDVDWFTGGSCTAKLSAITPAGVTISETAPFTINLGATGEPRLAEAPPFRSAGEVRVVTWNVFKGRMFSDPEPFARVLRALNPDIIALQEAGDATTRRQLADWLEEHVPSARGWDVSVEPGCDTAIASKLSGLTLDLADGPDAKPVAATALLAADGRRRAAVVSVHLKCCGRVGDGRDRNRIAEAAEIHRSLRKIRYTDNPSAIIVLGDFNLVGSREPLDTVALGNDLDGSDLIDLAPVVWGGSTTSTWRDREQYFPPGRLDFILVSDSTTTPTRSFAFDSALLSDSALSGMGLQRTDTSVSDHLPVVADLRW